jgi:beta-N-acetylhexosaminidase
MTKLKSLLKLRYYSFFLVLCQLFFIQILVQSCTSVEVQTTVLAQNYSPNFVLLENKHNLLPIIDLTNNEISIMALNSRFDSFQETINLYKSNIPTLSFDNTTILGLYLHQQFNIYQQINTTSKTKNQKNTPKNSAKNNAKSVLQTAITQTESKTEKQKIILLAYTPKNNIYDSLYDSHFKNLDSLFILQKTKCVFLHFGKPETLPQIENLVSFRSIIVADTNNTDTQNTIAQIIFGAMVAKGRLSQKLRKYPTKFGLDMPQLSRLQYVVPEQVFLTNEKIVAIDSLVITALTQKAMAGCQILIAKQGKVFYHKAFGYHTYDSTQKVTLTDKYDLASITKIAAGTLALMKLVEDKKIDLDKKLGDYLIDLKKSNKKDIILREMYAHQAQLVAGIQTWNYVSPKNSSKTKNAIYTHTITDSLYTKPDVLKEIWQDLKKTPLLPQKQYLYSDLPFIFTPYLVKTVAKQPIDGFVNQHFYKSLGTDLLFNPLNIYTKRQIVPTEYDSIFRKQQIHGTVHDETAALLGGVSGHAGLFGSANDLAKLMQMYLQKGEYGGKTYLKAETLLEFTRSQFAWEGNGNYRGIGFNRPAMNPVITGHTAVSASQQSFGHVGFTGTYTWVDVETGLLYVFLSNRVYPTRKNQKLMELNTRTLIAEKIILLLNSR